MYVTKNMSQKHRVLLVVRFNVNDLTTRMAYS